MLERNEIKTKIFKLRELGFPISTIGKHTGLGHARFYNLIKDRSAKFSDAELFEFDLYYEQAVELSRFYEDE
jgi:hypothetical protein